MPTAIDVHESVFRFRACRPGACLWRTIQSRWCSNSWPGLHFFSGRWGRWAGAYSTGAAAPASTAPGLDARRGPPRSLVSTFPPMLSPWHAVPIPPSPSRSPTPAIRRLDLGPGHWDRILSCEVLEHVPDMPAFLANLRRHLDENGLAFVSTPNRLVFSLGREPSPVNKEHIKELALDEFRAVLRPHFAHVEIYGQRFKDAALLAAWKTDVRHEDRVVRSGSALDGEANAALPTAAFALRPPSARHPLSPRRLARRALGSRSPPAWLGLPRTSSLPLERLRVRRRRSVGRRVVLRDLKSLTRPPALHGS